MTSHLVVRRARAAVALVGLAAPALVVSLAAAPAGSAAPAARAAEPAQRYIVALVNKKEVKKGKKVTISGRVDAPGVPACAAGVTVDVERSTKGAIYKTIGHVTTDSSTGAYSVSVKVTKKSRFRISVPATDACVEAQSPPRTVHILED